MSITDAYRRLLAKTVRNIKNAEHPRRRAASDIHHLQAEFLINKMSNVELLKALIRHEGTEWPK